jgi:CheY-like chemotaxis protein
MPEPRRPVAPLQSATPSAASATPQSTLPVRRAVVAGVDDPSLRLCRYVLERAGFHVDSVESGIAALMAARQGHPEFIVLDLQLRDVSSREAVSWLRSNAELVATPIYVLTANAQEEAGLSPLSKPLRKPVTDAAIRGLLDK